MAPLLWPAPAGKPASTGHVAKDQAIETTPFATGSLPATHKSNAGSDESKAGVTSLLRHGRFAF
jgi:hypothetical protein